MCCCGKPTINGQPGYSWDGKSRSIREPWFAELAEGDELLYDLPGRCGGVDWHSHDLRVVKQKFGGHALLVHHGGGEERIPLGYDYNKIVGILALLDDHARFWLLIGFYSLQREAVSKAISETNSKWRKAAADKRIKTRKYPAQGVVKVWIEDPKPQPAQT